MSNRSTAALLLLGLAPWLPGCDSGDGGLTQATGTLRLRLADAPVDLADKVVVRFSGITLKPANVNPRDHVFTTPKSIDLLQYQAPASTMLFEEKIPDGDYEWLRLNVDAQPNVVDSYIEINGQQYELTIPSGAETGLKLVGGFTIPANGELDFTIDFDLRRSVLPPSGSQDYRLKPALRIVSTAGAGGIQGRVDPNLFTVGCSPAVYAYQGANVTPVDVRSGGGPLNTALVNEVTQTYRLGLLPPGDYTLAFTCQAGDDQPESVETIVLSNTDNVTVSAGATATLDF